MSLRDVSSNLGPAQSISARAVTAAVNGTGVDLQGFDGAMLYLDLGTFAGTTPGATIRWEESDDNSTFTAIAAGDLLGGLIAAIDTTNDDQIHKRSYLGNKRYVRAAVTAVSGTGPSLPMAASVVRGHPSQRPVA